MSVANRLPSFDGTMIEEGGATLSTVRSDPGNWTGGKVGVGQLKGTKYGVAASAHPGVDIASLTREQAFNVFFLPGYWAPMDGDARRTGEDHVIVDDAYNAGAGSARKRVAQVDFSQSVAAVIHSYSKLRLSFFESLTRERQFLPGWQRRVARVEARGLEMAYNEMGAASGVSSTSVAAEAASAGASAKTHGTGAAAGATAGAGGIAAATQAGQVSPIIVIVIFAVVAAVIAFLVIRANSHSARANELGNLAAKLKVREGLPKPPATGGKHG